MHFWQRWQLHEGPIALWHVLLPGSAAEPSGTPRASSLCQVLGHTIPGFIRLSNALPCMQVCRRLKMASPTYVFPQRDLLQLGRALERADASRREKILLRPELLHKATAAAARAQARRGAGMAGSGKRQAGGSGNWGKGHVPSRQLPARAAAAGEQDGATDDVEQEDAAVGSRSNAWYSGEAQLP